MRSDPEGSKELTIRFKSYLLAVLLLSVLLGACRNEPQAASKPAIPSGKTRLFFLGVDGATWTVLHPLLERGDLPAFQRLIDEGAVLPAFDTLQITHSPVIWTRRGVTLEKATPYDLMPTMAWLLGLPLSDRLPGRILTEAFEDDFVAGKQVLRVARYGPRPEQPLLPSPEDEEMLRNLKNLGYIGD